MGTISLRQESSCDAKERAHCDRWGNRSDCNSAGCANVAADGNAGILPRRTSRTDPAGRDYFCHSFRGLRRSVPLHSRYRRYRPQALKAVQQFGISKIAVLTLWINVFHNRQTLCVSEITGEGQLAIRAIFNARVVEVGERPPA